MKFNLYVPTQQELDEWEEAAKEEHRSLSAFIRLAVKEKIERMRAR